MDHEPNFENIQSIPSISKIADPITDFQIPNVDFSSTNGSQTEMNNFPDALYCKYLDPICITCTTMVKEKTPCPTCHQLFTKVFRRYELKPCLLGDTIKFLAKIPPHANVLKLETGSQNRSSIKLDRNKNR